MTRNPDFDAVLIVKTELDKLRADNEWLRAALNLERRRLAVSEEALRRALENKP